MSKKFFAVNRKTGERWKPRPKGDYCGKEFLVMYDSGYLAVARFTDWEGYSIAPLDPKIWEVVVK